MDELKTCPCCGGLASSTSVGVTYDSLTPYFVQCIKCNLKTRRYMTSQEAEKVWNTRIEADEWISVDDERKPDKDQKIFCYCEKWRYGSIIAEFIISHVYEDDEFYSEDNGSFSHVEVTHWKPSIELPKETE